VITISTQLDSTLFQINNKQRKPEFSSICLTGDVKADILPRTVIKFEVAPQMDRFWTDDELKYATEEWLKEQSELVHFTGIEKNSEIASPIKSAFTKAVIVLKN